MTLDSSIVILIEVSLAAIFLLAVGVFWLVRSRRGGKMTEVERLIKQLGGRNAEKKRLLEVALVEHRGLDREAAAAIQQEVDAAERILLRRLIQLFLQLDEVPLDEIKKLIADLSAAYCKLLAESGYVPEEDDSDAALDKKIAELEHANQQLYDRLDTAMQTMSEIVGKYTHEFTISELSLETENDSKTTIFSEKIRKAQISPEELELCSKKMQQLFQDAEHRINSQIAELE